MSEKLEIERLDREGVKGPRHVADYANELASHIETLAREVAELRSWTDVGLEGIEQRVFHLETYNEKSTVVERLENLACVVNVLAVRQRRMVGELGDKQAQLGERYNTLSELRQFDIQRIQALEAANSAREGDPAEIVRRHSLNSQAPSASEISGYAKASSDASASEAVSDLAAVECSASYWQQRAADWEAMAGKLAEAARYWARDGSFEGEGPEFDGLDLTNQVLAEYEAMAGEEE